MDSASSFQTTNETQRIYSLYNNSDLRPHLSPESDETDEYLLSGHVDRYGNVETDSLPLKQLQLKPGKKKFLRLDKAAKHLTQRVFYAQDIARFNDCDIFTPHLSSINIAKAEDKENNRAKKWIDMCQVRMESGNQVFEFCLNKKLIRRTFKGVPDCWRSTAWSSFLGINTEKKALTEQYHRLCEMECAYDIQIDLDVPRTAASHILFRRRYFGGQRSLFRVLHAFALFMPSIGYVQGMASITVVLLSYLPEDSAFLALVAIMEKHGMQKLYTLGFTNLLTAFDTLKNELEYLPTGSKLSDLGIEPSAFVTRWYLTIFHQCVPFHTQLRIWDVLLLMGSDADKTIRLLQAVALALLRGLEEVIMDTDFEGAMQALSGTIPVQNDNALMAHVKQYWHEMPSEAFERRTREACGMVH
ncbi:GTPase activating protein [Schizosaccharomyces japonicus yFS275]|uniref:GTPase activating protein n=1 Tax=Schizosaccharomyces japonicus (strain yFS275 / FY16936) TaxID=402676 RepID=B6K3A1_SCHJY|nr:GTPase activating protein [Schizosaccharomyces japonicus yFS275]EEB07958.1 GTPase activating protein [Schizosaccharomyces japonicus yFS275]